MHEYIIYQQYIESHYQELAGTLIISAYDSRRNIGRRTTTSQTQASWSPQH